MDKKKIGNAIEIGLKRRHMTQTELAKIFCVSKPAVGQWIKGEVCPSGEKLLEIIEYLDIYKEVFQKDRESILKESQYKTPEELLTDRISVLEEYVKLFGEKLNVNVLFNGKNHFESLTINNAQQQDKL